MHIQPVPSPPILWRPSPLPRPSPKPPRNDHILRTIIAVGGRIDTQALSAWLSLLTITDAVKMDFFPLLLQPREVAEAALRRLRQERNWDLSSIATYLGSMVPVTKAATLLRRWPSEDLPGVRWLSPVLAAMNWESAALGPRWDPDDPTSVISPMQLELFRSRAAALCPLAIASLLATTAGVRLGDVLRLFTSSRRQSPWGPAILFILHKTQATKGPWTLHLSMDSPLVRQIDELTRRAKAGLSIFGHHPPGGLRPRPFLFLDLPLGSTKRLLEESVSRLEIQIKRHFSIPDVRAMRRTGLVHASAFAEDDSQLLTLSQHGNVPMLRTYLGAGLLSYPTRMTQLHLMRWADSPDTPAGAPGTF